MKKSLLISLLVEMKKIRMVEEEIAKRYSEGLMRCPVHLSIGQEAVAVGVCQNLKSQDQVFSAHRSHAHYLAKGGDLKSMIAEIYGKKTGCAGGKGGSMHLIDIKKNFLGAVPIVGSTIPMAVGASWGKKLQNKKVVTVVFFGDGATEEGIFTESINFASLIKSPNLFVCEDNLYSTNSPKKVRRINTFSLKKLVESHSIKYFSCDGNNVLDVYLTSSKAVKYIKKFGKPVFLELKTYRWLEHVGPNSDVNLGYRSKKEVLSWIKKCPIAFLTRYLSKKKIIQKNKISKIEVNIQKDINNAFEFALKSKFPSRSDLLTNIYKN